MRPIRVFRIGGKFVASVMDDSERITTYPEGRQAITLRDGTISYNWAANVVGSKIADRIASSRRVPLWPDQGWVETGDVHFDRSAEFWFIEARKVGRTGPLCEIEYVEITRDEAAAWLESHNYAQPPGLNPSLRLDEIFWVIDSTNPDDRRPVLKRALRLGSS
jgi:hypothetical protein